MAIKYYDPRVPVRVRRAESLGQVDNEFGYGPRPLRTEDVPADLLDHAIRSSIGSSSGGPSGGVDSKSELSQIVNDVHAIAGTLVLRRGLIGRVVPITSAPVVIIQQNEVGGRGYLLLNPAGVVGLTATGTLFPSTTVIGANTSLSAALGVANYKSAKFFVVATFVAGAGPVTFDLQTLDPASGTYITSQTIFNLVATGSAYVDVGSLGIDTDLQMLVTVPVGTTITFTVGYVLKDGLSGTSSGVTQTIFLGGAGVSATAGYPLLSGSERPFYLMENVTLYAVTDGPSLNMNIFEL